MKGCIKIGIVCLGMLFTLTSYAANNHNGAAKHKWLCETNASSSENEADKKADEMMHKDAHSPTKAFNYALKHCRDCSKITCTMETDQ